MCGADRFSKSIRIHYKTPRAAVLGVLMFAGHHGRPAEASRAIRAAAALLPRGEAIRCSIQRSTSASTQATAFEEIDTGRGKLPRCISA
jgi:hypothetical protein